MGAKRQMPLIKPKIASETGTERENDPKIVHAVEAGLEAAIVRVLHLDDGNVRGSVTGAPHLTVVAVASAAVLHQILTDMFLAEVRRAATVIPVIPVIVIATETMIENVIEIGVGGTVIGTATEIETGTETVKEIGTVIATGTETVIEIVIVIGTGGTVIGTATEIGTFALTEMLTEGAEMTTDLLTEILTVMSLAEGVKEILKKGAAAEAVIGRKVGRKAENEAGIEIEEIGTAIVIVIGRGIGIGTGTVRGSGAEVEKVDVVSDD